MFDRPIAFHRALVEMTGGVKPALMLGQLIYWSKRTKDTDGWVYKTQKEWEEETGLTRREQDTARKLLKERGIIQEKLAKSPARIHYRINPEYAQKRQTSLHKSAKLSIYKDYYREYNNCCDKVAGR